MPRKSVPPTPDQALWVLIRNAREAMRSDAYVGRSVVGTASIDDARLYELAGLDEADWAVVALQLQTDGETSSMAVLATRKDSPEWLAHSKAPLLVSRVKLTFPDAEPYRVLQVATEVFSPAMRRRGGRFEIVEEWDRRVGDA